MLVENDIHFWNKEIDLKKKKLNVQKSVKIR